LCLLRFLRLNLLQISLENNIFEERFMSNSMSLEKIFMILAVILGLGSTVDLIYNLVTLNLQLAEILRCSFNIVIALLIYLYANKKHKEKLNSLV
jgi:hypothetical protein